MIPANVDIYKKLTIVGGSIGAAHCVGKGPANTPKSFLFNGNITPVFSSTVVAYQNIGNQVANHFFPQGSTAHTITACATDVAVCASVGACSAATTGEDPVSGAIIGAATGLSAHLFPTLNARYHNV